MANYSFLTLSRRDIRKKKLEYFIFSKKIQFLKRYLFIQIQTTNHLFSTFVDLKRFLLEKWYIKLLKNPNNEKKWAEKAPQTKNNKIRVLL